MNLLFLSVQYPHFKQKKSSKFSRHIVHLNFFDYSLLDWKKASWYLIKNRYKLKLLFFLSYDNFLSINLTRMVVLLGGLIHAIDMYLVLRFKLIYKTQTSFYHIYCSCCVLVGLPFISILNLIIQKWRTILYQINFRFTQTQILKENISVFYYLIYMYSFILEL